MHRPSNEVASGGMSSVGGGRSDVESPLTLGSQMSGASWFITQT